LLVTLFTNLARLNLDFILMFTICSTQISNADYRCYKQYIEYIRRGRKYSAIEIEKKFKIEDVTILHNQLLIDA
jgi:hypothetical protein